MLVIPAALQTQFEEYLRNKAVPNRLQGEYKKWLRYYLDFCHKYKFPPTHKESLSHFIRKLQEKKQSKDQQGQAVLSITLYYEVVRGTTSSKETPLSSPATPPKPLPFKDEKPLSVRERTPSPLQFEKVVPPLSPVAATIKHPLSTTLNFTGKSCGYGDAGKKVNYHRGAFNVFTIYTELVS